MLIAKIAKRRIILFYFSLLVCRGRLQSLHVNFTHISPLLSSCFEDKAHFVSLKNGFFFFSFSQHDDDDNPLWRRFSLFFSFSFWHHVEVGSGRSLYRMDGATGNWTLGGWISLCLINFAFLYLFSFFLSLFDSNTKIYRSWLGEMS